jgi:hypothetical protein
MERDGLPQGSPSPSNRGSRNMTIIPKDIYEAYTIMLAELLGCPPHVIKYEANEEDWHERITHLQRIGNAVDAYVRVLGRDCESNSHVNLDMACFTDVVSNGLDDALGQMMQGAVAAREFETAAAE